MGLALWIGAYDLYSLIEELRSLLLCQNICPSLVLWVSGVVT
jgi:hypothetical protein